MERDRRVHSVKSTRRNFNSHAHVERDFPAINDNRERVSSTHTPTWSVTRHRFFDHFRYTISTHTLTWSVTCRLENTSAQNLHFNSHAHVERDCTQFGVDKCPKYFNSHAHVERDYTTGAGTAIVFNFNSHAHVERDLQFCTKCGRRRISTHTLTWSVTLYFFAVIQAVAISTHTLTWSVTRIIIYIHNLGYISTHTLTWSVTFGILRQQGSNWKFQLTRSRGA